MLKQLVALSIAAGCGVLDPTASLLRIPSELVTGAIAEVDERWPEEERRRLFRLLTHDPRVEVRARLADVAVTLWPAPRFEVHEVLRTLASDRATEVRNAAATGLAKLLTSLPPIARLELVCLWAVSEQVSERVALSRALTVKAPILASDLVLEQLAADPEVEVRRGAALAIAKRFHENPEAYRRLLQRLSSDADERVRRFSRSGLSEVA